MPNSDRLSPAASLDVGMQRKSRFSTALGLASRTWRQRRAPMRLRANAALEVFGGFSQFLTAQQAATAALREMEDWDEHSISGPSGKRRMCLRSLPRR